MLTADQLVAHAVGDYILQSDWMATEKTKKTIAALAHVATYALPFLFLTRSPAALAFIVVTHFIIDRWRLARYVCWAKNFIGPWFKFSTLTHGADAPIKLSLGDELEAGTIVGIVSATQVTLRGRWNPPWGEVKDSFGYAKDRPAWLAMWLMIITDNTMHVICNAIALHYFTR